MGQALGLEWPATLDLPALKARGWTPSPFTEFVVKVHSRCDLACDYCYVFEMADQSWRERPRRMSLETASNTAFRIGEHARAHNLTDVALILHGGEPLLAGPELIAFLLTAARREVGPRTRLHARIQTNGVGLDDEFLALLLEHEVMVGVSLDGTAAGHDRHRRFPSGRGSHAAVAAGLHHLMQARYRHLFSGLLCTIDLRNDPVETYQALLDFEPPTIDFLLPHGTWLTPPPGRVPGAPQTPYADWLITIFDHWYHAPRTRIRLFEAIIRLALGETTAKCELIGLAPVQVAVIETDGSVEQSDTLKASYDGAGYTGLHVKRDALDAALQLPGVAARQLGERGLSVQCRGCDLRRVCGGGLYAHRYRPGSGFANPSVYCPDLMRLIRHIVATVNKDIAARSRRRAAR
jgi:uncharacterized protein